MKITYNWLREFIDTDLSPEEIAEKITLSGIEVDSVTKHNEFLKDIVVSEITEISQVPDSDKLSLCKVFDGSEVLDIVCGAKNMQQGDKVALAKIGAVLPGDFKIKKSKIRGTVSYGMLCSEKELGFADDSTGIMILDKNLKTGENLGDALNLFDTVIEYEITPNRGDCLSVIGIARDLAAITGQNIKMPRFTINEIDEDINDYVTVEIENPELCPRYSAKIIKGITIQDSPLWFKNRLIAVGLRPINNIVDITNYVMYELGQPLHAFDYSFLEDKKIVVKTAEENQEFQTLDSKTHKLNKDNLLICDGKKPVALAGVMGGENSEVKNDTKDVLLESAFFDPSSVRKTSKELGILSDAAYRFERTIDISNVTYAADRAAYFMQELACGKVVKGIVDNYPLKKPLRNISLRKSRLDLIAGKKIDFENSKKILVNLGFKILKSDEELLFEVPSYRNDIFEEIDLIEEVLRIYGYNNIEEELPPSKIYPEYKYSFHNFLNDTKRFFKHIGFSEAVNYSFISKKYNNLFKSSEFKEVELLNPLTEDLEVLRFSILPGLLKNAKENINQKNENIKLFEAGKIFSKSEKFETGVFEEVQFAGVLTGKIADLNWCDNFRDVDFFDIKGMLEALFNEYRISNVDYSYPDKTEFSFLNCNKSAVITIGNKIIGFMGEINPNVMEIFEMEVENLLCFSLNIEKIFDKISKDIYFKELPKFPAIDRDIALLANDDIKSSEIKEIIYSEGKGLIENIFVFDLYKGKNIPEGKKSIAFKLIFRDSKGTLKAEKINKIMNKITNKLKETFKIQIR